MTTANETAAVRCIRANVTESAKEARQWGTHDRLGRLIGNTVTTYEVTFAPAPEDARSWSYTMVPGLYFAMYSQATRNGERHQASSREQFFTTAAERDAAVAKHFKGAEKRACDPKAATKA